MLSLSIALEGGKRGDVEELNSEAGEATEYPAGLANETPAERRHRAQALLLRWYETQARDLPWRRTRDPYAILVSEVMLQQTQVERVIPKYRDFLDRFPTLAALAEAPAADVIRAWAPLGYNRRAVNLQRLARTVVEAYGGLLPSDATALRALPGVGAYTAAAVACFAFGRPEAAIDTNVRRVLRRLEGPGQMNEAEVRQVAEAYLPIEQAADWNQALMDLSATICRAGTPLCLLCPVRSVCRSAARGIREAGVGWQTAGKAAPFKGSDRYLRGRIVDMLRAEVAGRSVDDLATALDLTDGDALARLERLLLALERDGLLVVEHGSRVARLPS